VTSTLDSSSPLVGIFFGSSSLSIPFSIFTLIGSGERENPYDFSPDIRAILPPLKGLQLLNNTTSARMPMSEPGKVEERRSTDMSLYHLLRKAGNGFGFRHYRGNARLQRSKAWSLKQEKVLVNHVTVEQEAHSFSVGSSHWQVVK
jgi:hypothetical protein